MDQKVVTIRNIKNQGQISEMVTLPFLKHGVNTFNAADVFSV